MLSGDCSLVDLAGQHVPAMALSTRLDHDDDMSAAKWAGLTVLMVVAGGLAGCSSAEADGVLAEDQVSSDALPQADSELLEALDSASARYLGEAEGAKYWAAHNADDEFCVLGQVVGDPENMVTSCGPSDGDTLAVSLKTGPTATWSAIAGPPVPDASTLLRDHLVVTPR